MASENESIESIVSEMRDTGNYQSYSGDHAKRLADRIEAAWQRERQHLLKAVQDAAAGF